MHCMQCMHGNLDESTVAVLFTRVEPDNEFSSTADIL